MDVVAAQALLDLVTYIEGRFPDVVDMTDEASASKFIPASEWKPQFAPTGESYVVFTPHRTPELVLRTEYKTPEAVISAGKEQFEIYAADKTGTLYWRIKPEVECFKDGKNARCWMFYMRLLISDKPYARAST